MVFKKEYLSQCGAIVFYAALLFSGAGSCLWLEGWFFLFLLVCLNFAIDAHNNVYLLIARSHALYGVPSSFGHRVSMTILGLLALCWILSNGLDTVRYQVTEITFLYQCLGAVASIVCLIATYWVIEWNYSTAVVVRSQEREQNTTLVMGPYSRIRHPMYLMSCLFLPSASLMMASILGLLISMLFVIWTCIHIYFEDKLLQQHIPRYKQYAQKVRYRLIPYVY